MKYLYFIYQYLIAWPLLVVITFVCAVFAILLSPLRNTEFMHKILQLWARSFFWLMFIPVSVDGQEHIQKGQSYVFVANHQSMFDVWLIYGWLPVIYKWLMKRELRRIPLVGLACKAAGHIFVDRRNAKAAMESIKKVEKQLVNGVCTTIFPEGTRSLNGEVGRFKRGAFQIAIDLGLPVIPLSLDGCFEVLPKGKPYISWHRVHMHIGEPIDLKHFADENGKIDNNAAIDAVRNAVIEGRQK